MSTLKSRLDSLASSFAADIVRAIQGASLEELLGEIGGSKPSPGRLNLSSAASARFLPAASAASVAKAGAARSKGRGTGRLQRRSPEDIAETLDRIVALVKRHKEGLRAEQIRSELKMQAKEMPRVLKEGLAKKMLSSKGQKRATTYFAR